MEEWLKAFASWDKENHEFIEELHEHQSILYDRLYPVYAVLDMIAKQSVSGEIEINDDIDKIVSVGLEFLHDQIDTCKLYIDTKFNGDLHDFLTYDQIVNAMFFIDDLKYELAEKEIEYDRESLEQFEDELEDFMNKKKPVNPDLNLYIDDKLSKVIDNQKVDFYGIVDIFTDIADTLGLDLYTEEEILIGRDI